MKEAISASRLTWAKLAQNLLAYDIKTTSNRLLEVQKCQGRSDQIQCWGVLLQKPTVRSAKEKRTLLIFWNVLECSYVKIFTIGRNDCCIAHQGSQLRFALSFWYSHISSMALWLLQYLAIWNIRKLNFCSLSIMNYCPITWWQITIYDLTFIYY